MRTKLLLATLGLAGAAFATALSQQLYLPSGEVAPVIVGKGTDDKEYNLSRMTKEKPAFVVFWKERCPHNKKASALFNQLKKAYGDKVQFVGVVNANEEGAKAWVKQFELNYPLLADVDKEDIKAYKLRFSITTVQVGTDGKIAKVFEGYGTQSISSLNEAMAKAADMKPAELDLTGAPEKLTWG